MEHERNVGLEKGPLPRKQILSRKYSNEICQMGFRLQPACTSWKLHSRCHVKVTKQRSPFNVDLFPGFSAPPYLETREISQTFELRVHVYIHIGMLHYMHAFARPATSFPTTASVVSSPRTLSSFMGRLMWKH